MFHRHLIIACLAVLQLVHAGCSPSNTTETPSDAHPLKGIVIDTYPEQLALLVDHEEIPGFMSAMTMQFVVDSPTFTTVKKGDTITARLRFTDSTWRLENVKVMRKP